MKINLKDNKINDLETVKHSKNRAIITNLGRTILASTMGKTKFSNLTFSLRCDSVLRGCFKSKKMLVRKKQKKMLSGKSKKMLIRREGLRG